MKILSQQNYINPRITTNPNFSGRVSVFSKKMDRIIKSTNSTQAENVNLVNLLKKMLDKKLKKKSFLGVGCRGVVVPLDSKYVLKLDKTLPLKFDIMSIPVDKFRDLTFKSYFGGIVAKFGNVRVLKNVSKTGNHLPAGVPTYFSEHNSLKDCVEYYEKKYLPRFASLPQKSFDDVAYDFKLLNKNSADGHCFDVRNPNNFVLVGRKIKIVDSICQSFETEMTTADLLSPFLFLQDVANECSYSAGALNNRRKLFKKLILAGLKNDLHLMNGGNSFVFEEVLEYLCKSKVDTQRFSSDILNLKLSHPNKKEFLSMVKKYLNNIFDASNYEVVDILGIK